MEFSTIKNRLRKDRPMKTITMRLPEDVIEDLKRVAPYKGISGHQPLIRAYIGQGLRADLEALEHDSIDGFVKSLERQGVSRKTIRTALGEVGRG